MTLESAASKAVYTGNGATTEFPFSFKVWEKDQILVSITDARGYVQETGEYSVTLSAGGGTVSYLHAGAPLPSGWKLAITRDMPFTQEDDYITGTRFDPAVIETALDKATAERQQLREQLQRAVILPPTSDETPEDMAQELLKARDEAVKSAGAAKNSEQAAADSASDAAASEQAAAEHEQEARKLLEDAQDTFLNINSITAEAETLEPGEAAAVDFVPDSLRFFFKIPRGMPGKQGPAGATGPQGARGGTRAIRESVDRKGYRARKACKVRRGCPENGAPRASRASRARPGQQERKAPPVPAVPRGRKACKERRERKAIPESPGLPAPRENPGISPRRWMRLSSSSWWMATVTLL
ncbi:hypothetical protein [Desulfovibrio piger]|uniref:hypothetical protein n=1 Tax=Desulfovibrio piger TaxID=901 RepID=UPI0039F59517